MNRRHFMQHAAGSLAATSVGATFAGNVLAAGAPGSTAKKQGKHLIMLYCGGGPPTIDMFSEPAKESKNRIFDLIPTAADGVRVSEVFTETAKVMKDLAIIDAYQSKEGDHDRGHTKSTKCMVDLLTLGVQVPGIGAVAGYFLGNEDLSLPRCVTIGDGRAGDAGFLGASYSGFPCQNAGQIPENVGKFRIGDDRMTDARYGRRRALFDLIEDQYTFGVTNGVVAPKERRLYQDAAEAHRELCAKAFDVTLKTGAQVFQFDAKDNDYLKKHNADNGFGRSCYLATKLIQNGVVSVECGIGGWDMHGNVEQGVRTRGKELDSGIGVLMSSLRDTGMIDNTVVVLVGDFGRTPNINQGMGRDHYGAQWSMLIGGGLIKCGQRYGKMNGDCNGVIEKPVSTEQLFATIYTALGIDLKDRLLDLHDNLGRRYYIAGAKGNAEPVAELLNVKA
jgi:hypothetical protein